MHWDLYVGSEPGRTLSLTFLSRVSTFLVMCMFNFSLHNSDFNRRFEFSSI